jgi:hypothetical protein
MSYLQIDLLNSHAGNLQDAPALFSVSFSGDYDFSNLSPVVDKADKIAALVLDGTPLETLAYRVTRH